jgi:hypothetical protein
MSERRKTHNGRDTSGNFKVKQGDVEDIRTEPEGVDVIRDDVKLGGAVEDTGPTAGLRGEHIGELVDDNRDDVARATTGRPARKKHRS